MTLQKIVWQVLASRVAGSTAIHRIGIGFRPLTERVGVVDVGEKNSPSDRLCKELCLLLAGPPHLQLRVPLLGIRAALPGEPDTDQSLCDSQACAL